MSKNINKAIQEQQFRNNEFLDRSIAQKDAEIARLREALEEIARWSEKRCTCLTYPASMCCMPCESRDYYEIAKKAIEKGGE